jgi:glutamate receptor, ionotropic, invertebrate
MIVRIFSRFAQAESALMFDSVYVFAKGLAALDQGYVLKPANLSCDLENPWEDGLSLYNYINTVIFTHNISFKR